MSALDRTKEVLADLIAFPTISADSNLEMVAYLADRLESIGAKVEMQQDASGAKANLFATLGPERDGGIVLSGHTDVVPVADQNWHSDPFQMVERGGRLFGRGSCDMKGFIAATLTMAPLMAEKSTRRPVHFAFTYDEETGCIGAGHLADFLRQKEFTPGIAIIGEPTEMRVIEGHKGCYEYKTRFRGLEGHGSTPDRGVNAVEYAVRFVHRLLGLKDQLKGMASPGSRFEPPWTTVNVGVLKGGVAQNVIASSAEIEWEMRPVQKSDADYVKFDLAGYCQDELLPKMQAVFADATIETEVMGEVDGLVPADRNEAVRIVSELVGANQADLVPFGTEAGIFQSLGMDVVVCGPGSIEQAHKADEFVSLDQLMRCLSMLEGLVQKIAA
jgi:acetylornithine deacetylase